MKITAIRPLVAWVGTRNQLLVKVETDEGIFGWGESGLSGREKAVAGAVEHYAQFLVGQDPMQMRRALAGDVPQPVLRRRPRAHRGDLGDRHRAPRHQGQGAGRAGLPASRRQATRPHSDLRDDRGDAGPGNDRAGAAARRARLELHPLHAGAGQRSTTDDLRAARVDRQHGELVRRRRARRSAATSCSASTITTGSASRRRHRFCQKMPPRHPRLHRGADPRRNARSLRGSAPA